MTIKHEAKPSALLALRPRDECFILCIAQGRYIYIIYVNSYTMGTSGLLNMYTLSSRATGLRMYILGKPQVYMV